MSWFFVAVMACKLGGEGFGVALDQVMSDFSLVDVNIASDRFDTRLSPRDFQGDVSVWYFGHSNCGICRSQFGLLSDVAQELPEIPFAGIDAASVIAAGDEERMDDVASLPWLADTDEFDAWGQWGADWRDVYILDAENKLVAVYNLTDNRLEDPDNFAALVATIEDARD